MRINPSALDKLKSAPFTSESVVRLLDVIAEPAMLLGVGETHITLDWQSHDCDPLPGDLIPYITIGLRPANLDPAQVDEYVKKLESE